MPLNEKALRALKPREKAFKVSDERSLYFLVSPSGARCWRFKYRIAGTEKVLALGTYPDVSLKVARERRDDARRLIAAGTDPGVKRKAERIARADSFSAIAKEWLDLQRKMFSPATLTKAEWTFDELLNPYIGSRPIRDITPPELLVPLHHPAITDPKGDRRAAACNLRIPRPARDGSGLETCAARVRATR